MDLNHKSNRERSSSAKWASDVHLAVEYLKRQHEVVEWLQHAMDRTFSTHDLQELLKSGVVLRELMAHFAPTTATPKPIARTYSATMAPWKERENISVFLADCRRLGMSECSLFGTDDLYEGTNMVQVVFGMQYIKAWFTGGVRSPRSPKNAPVGVWSFSESQVQDVLAQFQKHKSQETLLQGFLTRQGSSSDVRQPEHANDVPIPPATTIHTTNDSKFVSAVENAHDLPAFPAMKSEPHIDDVASSASVVERALEEVHAAVVEPALEEVCAAVAEPAKPVEVSPTVRDDDTLSSPTEDYILATTPILTDPPSDEIVATSSAASHSDIVATVHEPNSVAEKADAVVPPAMDPSVNRQYGCCCRLM